MSEFMRMETRYANGLGGIGQRGPLECLRLHDCPTFSSEDEIVWALALDVASKDVHEKRGSGTSRRSWPFVGPKVITPFTGVTDSATKTRRRRKSMRRTLSAAIAPHRKPA
jgi:hypothetical protein